MRAWKTAFRAACNLALLTVLPDGIRYRGPQELGTPPQVTYFIVTDLTAKETGPQDVRIQIDVWTVTDQVADQIRELLRTALHDVPFDIVGATHHLLREINYKELFWDDDLKAFHWVIEYRSLFHRD